MKGSLGQRKEWGILLNKKKTKMFYEYLRLHKNAAGIYLIFSIIFGLIFFLARLPLLPVLYVSLLGLFVAAIILASDYRKFIKKHDHLESLVSEIMVTDEHFPVADDLIEEDYQCVLQALYDEKLRLAETMDERYSDMMEYYTLWVHQIKTPISAMRLILQGEDDEKNRALLDELLRIEQYVEMVLAYLRLDGTSTDYVIKSCNLDLIIKQAVRKYASQFIRKKIRLVYEPVSFQVVTDEKWLLFVIEQVLSNALKYTRKGSIEISLDSSATLCIKDTGIGIAPEDLPRIFEKGFTGYNGRTDMKASGIGLYLCRRICSRLGHKIEAVSQVGIGTEIRIHLGRKKMVFE